MAIFHPSLDLISILSKGDGGRGGRGGVLPFPTGEAGKIGGIDN